MSEAIISFQRRFQIWLYMVSHGQLLLRSNRSDNIAMVPAHEKFSTRIDVLFKDVATMALPTLFDGLWIAEAATDETRDLNVQLGAWRLEKRKVFAISGTNFRGYIVAGAVAWHEDDGSYSDPSYFEDRSLRIPRSA